ncbi:hypothetical protein AABD41_01465 [Staphylococcus pseudoxylosus]|uniref:hypothetical protein n=1 Tax=Staphylococcus pseudoxylosus TaxID=2282419 RepID=UPI00398B8268
MNNIKLGFNKKELEELYKTKLSNFDLEIINQKLKWFSYGDLVEDTKLFENIKDYVNYSYNDIDGYTYLINRLIKVASEEPNALHKTTELLIDYKDIKLTDGKVILVMQ